MLQAQFGRSRSVATAERCEQEDALAAGIHSAMVWKLEYRKVVVEISLEDLSNNNLTITCNCIGATRARRPTKHLLGWEWTAAHWTSRAEGLIRPREAVRY